MTPAEQQPFWANRPRDMTATGLQYSQNICDHKRFAAMIRLNSWQDWRTYR